MNSGKRVQTISKPAELPAPHQSSGLAPSGLLIAERRQRRRLVHSGDRAIEAQLVGLARESPRRDGILQRAVLAQQVGRAYGSDTDGTRDPVGRITAQGNEVGHLVRLDTIAL